MKQNFYTWFPSLRCQYIHPSQHTFYPHLFFYVPNQGFSNFVSRTMPEYEWSADMNVCNNRKGQLRGRIFIMSISAELFCCSDNSQAPCRVKLGYVLFILENRVHPYIVSYTFRKKNAR